MGVMITRQTNNSINENKEGTKFSEHKIIITNRKNLQATGILKIIATSENVISVDTINGGLNIFGNNLHILKISVEEGLLNAEGIFSELKYVEKKEKQSFMKRMFK